jgi:hypothetical protein
MRRSITLLIVAAFVAMGSASLVAQGKSSGPKATPTAHGPKVSTGQATTTRGPKSTHTGGSKAPKTTTRAPQSNAHGTKSAKGATTTTTATATSPNLPRNQRLVERLRTLLDLPPGTDMAPYAAGFKNQGQFVASVHVSENLGINFTDLKLLMVDKNLSLGQAIHQLKPGVDANVEAQRAVSQSRER